MNISGTVNENDLIEVLRFLESMKVTGSLTIKGNCEISVVFNDGIIQGALTADKHSSIIEQIASIKQGQYMFSPNTEKNGFFYHEISTPPDQFYHELSRHIINGRVDKNLYQSDMVFELAPTTKVTKISFSPDEWRVIAMLSGKASIAEIQEKVMLDNQIVRSIMYSLEQAGLIKRIRHKKQEPLGSRFMAKIRNFLGIRNS